MTPRMTFRPVLLALLALGPLAVAIPALAADDAPRLVSVSGEGEIVAQPDIAFVTLGVEARRPTMAEARAEVAKTVDAVLAADPLAEDRPEAGQLDPPAGATRVQLE